MLGSLVVLACKVINMANEEAMFGSSLEVGGW